MAADNVTIRAYRDEDWAAVCAVHDRARPAELEGSCDTRAFVPLADEREDAASFHRSRKFVACGGKQVVGFVGVDGAYVSWLYVDPGCQGRGIGGRLLRFAVGLIGAGAWTIALEGNARARRLYEREGFEIARAFDTANAGYPCRAVELRLRPDTGDDDLRAHA